MRTTRWLATLAVASLLVAVAACGNDDDATTTTAADGTTETTRAPGGTGESVDVEAALDLSIACDEPDGEPIKIGYAADFSDLGGYADVPGAAAAEFMVERINCAGGVNGQPLELVVRDIQGDPDVTQRAAEELLEDGVVAILGPPFSDFGLPLLSVVDGRVPVIFVASTEVVLPDAENGSFLVAFDDVAQASAAAEFALDAGFETAVTFSSPDAPYFQQNPTIFATEFQSGGGEILGDYTYSLADSDFSTQVNQIAALPEPPDVLYTAMIMPLIETLIGQLNGAGLGDIVVIGADAFDATGILGAGALAEGVHFTTHGFPGPGSRMLAFLDAYAEDTGSELETVSFGTLAADAILVVAEAIAQGGDDPQAITDAIRAIAGLDLITEEVTYAGTNGTPIKPVFVLAVQDGEYVFVDSFVPTAVGG